MLHFPEGWRDFTSQLQALAARFNAANTAFYVMDPTFETGGSDVPPVALTMNGKIRKVKISCDRKDVRLVTQAVFVRAAL